MEKWNTFIVFLKAGSDRMAAIQELAKRKGATSMQGLDRKEPKVSNESDKKWGWYIGNQFTS